MVFVTTSRLNALCVPFIAELFCLYTESLFRHKMTSTKHKRRHTLESQYKHKRNEVTKTEFTSEPHSKSCMKKTSLRRVVICCGSDVNSGGSSTSGGRQRAGLISAQEDGILSQSVGRVHLPASTSYAANLPPPPRDAACTGRSGRVTVFHNKRSETLQHPLTHSVHGRLSQCAIVIVKCYDTGITNSTGIGKSIPQDFFCTYSQKSLGISKRNFKDMFASDMRHI